MRRTPFIRGLLSWAYSDTSRFAAKYFLGQRARSRRRSRYSASSRFRPPKLRSKASHAFSATSSTRIAGRRGMRTVSAPRRAGPPAPPQTGGPPPPRHDLPGPSLRFFHKEVALGVNAQGPALEDAPFLPHLHPPPGQDVTIAPGLKP